LQFVARAPGKTFVDHFSSGANRVDDGVIDEYHRTLLSTVNLSMVNQVQPPGMLVMGVEDQAISDVKDAALLCVIYSALSPCVVAVLDISGVGK
jgi:hypothetical protein